MSKITLNEKVTAGIPAQSRSVIYYDTDGELRIVNGTLQQNLVIVPQNIKTIKCKVTSATITTSTYSIDLSLGVAFSLTLSANTALSFINSNFQGTTSVVLFITQDGTGGRTCTLPTNVKWPSNTTPTVTSTASRTDIYQFTSDTNGTGWYGTTYGQNFS